MSRRKKPESTRRMGKYSSYDLIDGSYYIAPHHEDTIKGLLGEKSSVHQLVRSFNHVAKEMFHQIVEAELKWWNLVMDDLGLDPKLNWKFSSPNRIYLAKEESDSEPEKETR